MDAWYYMRHIENMVETFPHFNAFDPYVLYPGGGTGLPRPFFGWLIAGIVLLVGGGAPTQHIIDAVGAYMPAILGGVALIPVYFIGKELFNRWVGVISAALVAILPGEFLNRSLLGFTDHHVAETLFSTACILFLIMAIKRAREKELTFGHLLHRGHPHLTSTLKGEEQDEGAKITRPLIYTLIAGIFLGMYLLSWIGGLLVVFIIFAYLVIQFVVDHLRHKSTDYLCLVGTSIFLIAFLMLLPVLGKGGLETIYRVSMLAAIAMPIVLSVISRLMARRAWKPVYYPLTLLGLAGIGLAALHAIDPSLLQYMLRQFSIFAPVGPALTILEMHPLTLNLAWANFTTSFFISFISFAMLAYVIVKERSADKTLFLVWSIIMLIAVLGQRRFGYYYAVNAALLTGYFSWKMLDIAGLRKLFVIPAKAGISVKKFKKTSRKTREKAKPKTFLQPRATWIRVILVAIAIFFLVFFPNIDYAKAVARAPSLIDQGWYSSLLWLKDNSAEPFDDPDFYYKTYPSKADFEYPETAYGVMSWWDYGYWIMRISQRIPNANPMQAGARQVARFFVAQDESSANELADRSGSKYVVIDHAMPTTKFYAMPEWAGISRHEFYEVYHQPTEDGRLQPITLFYPAYYNSTVVRLYNFDGKAIVPQETIVISYQEKVSREGVGYREITGTLSFSTYEGAEAYIADQESGNYRIVSSSPLITPVPLEQFNSYKLVHESDVRARIAGESLPGVKIFEYLGPGEP